MKYDIPFRPSSVAYQVMLGSLQGGEEGGWADLTVQEIAEVLNTKCQQVQNALWVIKRKTGYSVPHLTRKQAIRRDDYGE